MGGDFFSLVLYHARELGKFLPLVERSARETDILHWRFPSISNGTIFMEASRPTWGIWNG